MAGCGGGELLEALEGDLEEGGYHHDGKDENADWFETSPPDWVGVFVASGDEFGCRPHDGCAEEVECCVDEGGEDREGAREYHHGDFACE